MLIINGCPCLAIIVPTIVFSAVTPCSIALALPVLAYTIFALPSVLVLPPALMLLLCCHCLPQCHHCIYVALPVLC
jgi:hypothetical protein